MDASCERDIGGAIIAPIAGTLKRAELRELGFPIAQYVLRDAKLGAQLADRPEGIGRLFAAHHSRITGRSGRA